MTDKQNNCKYFDKETGAKMVETFRWYRKVLLKELVENAERCIDRRLLEELKR